MPNGIDNSNATREDKNFKMNKKVTKNINRNNLMNQNTIIS